MQNELTPIQQLDAAIKFLAPLNKRYITHDELKKECFHNNENIDVEAIILKLQEDKFIHYGLYGTLNSNKFKITLTGQIFNAENGYEGEIIRQNAGNIRLDKIDSAQKNFRRSQNWLLIFVALGTLIAGIYYAIEILKYFCLIRK